MRKQPEIRARTRERLIDAFFSQYAESSLRGVTVGGITNSAHMNRSTFYEYFEDVYDLIEKAEDDLIDEIRNTASEIIGNGARIDAGALAEKGGKLFEHRGGRLYILFAHADSGFSDRLIQAMRPLMKSALNIDVDHPESELIVSFALSGIVGSLSSWYAMKKSLPQDEMVTLIQQLMAAVLAVSSTATVSPAIPKTVPSI